MLGSLAAMENALGAAQPRIAKRQSPLWNLRADDATRGVVALKQGTPLVCTFLVNYWR